MIEMIKTIFEKLKIPVVVKTDENESDWIVATLAGYEECTELVLMPQEWEEETENLFGEKTEKQKGWQIYQRQFGYENGMLCETKFDCGAEKLNKLEALIELTSEIGSWYLEDEINEIIMENFRSYN